MNATYQIGFIQDDNNTPIPDGIVVQAYSTDGNNTLIETETIGNNVAPNQGVAAFFNLVPGVEYNFIFTTGGYTTHAFTMPTTPYIISGSPGAQGPQGPTGAQGPAGPTGPQGPAGSAAQNTYDIIQTYEVSNSGPTTIFTYVTSRALTLQQTPTTGGTHVAYAAYTMTTQTVVFNLHKNGSTQFGTLTFAPGANRGTFNITGTTSFAVGDFISIDFASSSDSTAVGNLAINNFIITLCPTLL